MFKLSKNVNVKGNVMSTMTPPRDVTIDIMLNFDFDSDAHVYAYCGHHMCIV